MQQTNMCPNCGAPVAPGQRFCGNCGGQLSTGCPYCGAVIGPGARFCANCGAAAGGVAPQQPGWGQQQPGWGQPQPGWGQPQPGWGAQTAGGPPSSNRPLLLVLLAVVLIGLGGLVYWQFGDQIMDLFSSSSNGSSSTADTTAPTISDIEVTASQIGARIDWKTNEAASSQVEYGTDNTTYGSFEPSTPAYDPTGGTSAGVVVHSVVLTGLTEGTDYHYRVRSKDAAGNEAISEDRTFTTEVTN